MQEHPQEHLHRAWALCACSCFPAPPAAQMATCALGSSAGELVLSSTGSYTCQPSMFPVVPPQLDNPVLNASLLLQPLPAVLTSPARPKQRSRLPLLCCIFHASPAEIPYCTCGILDACCLFWLAVAASAFQSSNMKVQLRMRACSNVGMAPCSVSHEAPSFAEFRR